MRRPRDFFIRGTVIPPLMGAAVILAVLALFGATLLPVDTQSQADMRLNPTHARIAPEDSFAVSVVVESPMPVNVFSGELRFDPSVLSVSTIDYNTSIADLWAERPWYENGAGTINFIGGTTRPGGFVGTGELITIHFTAHTEGVGTLLIKDAHILQHDGLGTDAPLREPIDALFTVTAPQSTSTTFFAQDALGTTYTVSKHLPSPDLNGDGVQSFTDVSILLLNLASNDPRFDINGDGDTNYTDLTALLELY